jgi:hypothetical protein
MTAEEKRIRHNERQRIRRSQTKNSSTKKYEKTKGGFLMRLYRNMESRITGVQKQKHHLYEGKTLLDRESFYEWANNSLVFHSLFEKWENSGYDRKLAPSVDRINSLIGYELGNIEWVTHSENSRRGNQSKFLKRQKINTAA